MRKADALRDTLALAAKSKYERRFEQAILNVATIMDSRAARRDRRIEVAARNVLSADLNVRSTYHIQSGIARMAMATAFFGAALIVTGIMSRVNAIAADTGTYSFVALSILMIGSGLGLCVLRGREPKTIRFAVEAQTERPAPEPAEAQPQTGRKSRFDYLELSAPGAIESPAVIRTRFTFLEPREK